MYKYGKRGVGSPGGWMGLRKREKNRRDRDRQRRGDPRSGEMGAVGCPGRPQALRMRQRTVSQRWGLDLLTRSLPDTGPSWEQTPHTHTTHPPSLPLPQPILPQGIFNFSGLWNVHLSDTVTDVAATNTCKYGCTLIFSPASPEEKGASMQVWGDREGE